jgi:uncharacterized membrane protein
MNDRIKAHVDSLFEGAPQTRKVLDLKEELLANLNSKYDDLISGGAADDDAYRSVIAGIGDISELVRQIQNESAFNSHYPTQERKKNALLVAIAVGLYIISPMCVVAFNDKGVLVMFALIAVATGILIYNRMTRTRYIKEDETIVEEFKQWKSENSETKQLRKSISSVLWPLIVVIYLAFSFLTGAWGISWIIFIIGVFIEGVIKLIFEIKG